MLGVIVHAVASRVDYYSSAAWCICLQRPRMDWTFLRPYSPPTCRHMLHTQVAPRLLPASGAQEAPAKRFPRVPDMPRPEGGFYVGAARATGRGPAKGFHVSGKVSTVARRSQHRYGKSAPTIPPQ